MGVLFSKAQTIIDKRREKSKSDLLARKSEIYSKFPRLLEIEKELDRTGVKLLSAVADLKMSPEEATEKIMAQNLELNSEIQEILKHNGYPKDYLEETHFCNKCKDTGLDDGKICSCLKQEITDMSLSDANLAKSMKDCTFSSFKIEYYSQDKSDNGYSPRDAMRRVLEICEDFVKNFDKSSENLLFYGKSGLGKTFLSSAIANELISQGKDVLYISANTLFPIFEALHFGREVSDKEKYLAEHTLSAELLILDDLGAEYITPFTSSELFRVVNNRILSDKKMIFSTNLSLNELSSNYSERITSRIIGYFSSIHFIGEDIRKIKKYGK